MNPQVKGLRVASVVFGLMAVAQLGRLIVQPEVLVSGHLMPLWPSIIAAPVFAVLCIWLWRLARRP